jgi:hypothetical protein
LPAELNLLSYQIKWDYSVINVNSVTILGFGDEYKIGVDCTCHLISSCDIKVSVV